MQIELRRSLINQQEKGKVDRVLPLTTQNHPDDLLAPRKKKHSTQSDL